MTDIIREINKRDVNDQKIADQLKQNRVEGFVVETINELGADGVFSDADVQTVERRLHAAYPGYESKELKELE